MADAVRDRDSQTTANDVPLESALDARVTEEQLKGIDPPPIQHSQTFKEPGHFGGPLRHTAFSVDDHPGVRRYRTAHDELRHRGGLFSLVQRDDAHSHDIAWHHAEHHVGPDGKEIDPDLVVFEGPDDPIDPKSWSVGAHVGLTAVLGLSTFLCAFASSVFSAGNNAFSAQFGISSHVGVLSTSLFVLGYAVASELFGRRMPILVSFFCFMIFQIPVAVGQNVETIMLGRFFGGCFAAGPMTIVPGALSDFWPAEQRGIAMAIFALATFGGPAIGPVIGSFTVINSNLGWRWTAYFTLIMAAAVFVILIFFLKETFVPVLLQQKAKRIRFSEKRWAVRSKLDETELSLGTIVDTYMLKPIKMTLVEPALTLINIYMGFLYGLLYLLFGAVPLEFALRRGLSPGIASLPFLSFFIGCVLGCVTVAGFSPRYNRILHATGAISVPRERLIPMMIGAVLFPVSIFWYGWTDVRYVSSPWPQIIALGLFGYGLCLVFLCAFNWIVDTYLRNASSAMAANTMIRSIFGAAFPLFAVQTFENLGYAQAASMIGGIATALAPVPFVFYALDETLRKKSTYAPFMPPANKKDEEKSPSNEKATPLSESSPKKAVKSA